MLVLTRRAGEEIDMTLTTALPAGARVRIVVMEVQRGRARIGIEAPRSVTVDRSEITQRKENDVEADGNVE